MHLKQDINLILTCTYAINVLYYTHVKDQKCMYFVGPHFEDLGIGIKRFRKHKVVEIWPGLIVCKQVTVCPGHIWTTL
jgi:hypothetical protein